MAATQDGGGFNPLFSFTCRLRRDSTKEVGSIDTDLAIELEYYSVIQK